jgi:hypothetical protein
MEEDDDGHPPKCFGELAFLIFSNTSKVVRHET